VFSTTYPSTDLFLVVKLEKVLQGDISECTEPYIKDDKVTYHLLILYILFSELKTLFFYLNREKIKANAVACCERLGRYPMPFAWTGIHLHSILHGASSIDRERDKTADRDTVSTDGASAASGANSLGNHIINFL